MNLKTANKHCKKLSCQYGIVEAPVVVPLKYSRMGKSVSLGYYNNQENKIELNKYMLELWPSKQIVDVIKHELMHARSYQDFGCGGHGKEFRAVCNLVGVGGNVARAIKTGV